MLRRMFHSSIEHPRLLLSVETRGMETYENESPRSMAI
jgi:hypothetical protein